jgi:hypothetical protein
MVGNDVACMACLLLTCTIIGILPRHGKHITYKQMSHAIQHAYNLAPTLADQLTSSAAQLDQGRG